MKKVLYISLLSVLIVACGGNKNEVNLEQVLALNDVTQLKALKKQIETEEQALSVKIEKLNEKISELEPNANLPLVTAKKINSGAFNHYVEVQGNVATKKNVLIYPERPGQLVQVLVKKGRKVAKGQVLARIDDGGLSNQLAQIKVQVALAKTTFERQQNLWNQKIGSEIQFLQAKANYEAQQKSVNQMQRALGKFVVRAPFTGVIDDVLKEQGTIVAPGFGSEIFRIVNLRNMYIEADVPEAYLPQVKIGKEVLINFPVLNKELKSKVRQVGSYINPANRTFKIEVAVPNKKGDIKPNLTARLKINDYSNKNAISIPQGVISENAKGEQYIYILTDKKENKAIAKKVIIETGKTLDGNIEVLKGLTADSEIIVEGARTVKDGQEVVILK